MTATITFQIEGPHQEREKTESVATMTAHVAGTGLRLYQASDESANDTHEKDGKLATAGELPFTLIAAREASIMSTRQSNDRNKDTTTNRS